MAPEGLTDVTEFLGSQEISVDLRFDETSFGQDRFRAGRTLRFAALKIVKYMFIDRHIDIDIDINTYIRIHIHKPINS